MTLFPESDSKRGRSYDDLLNPKHWFLIVGTGPFQIRNFTVGQTLLGDYDTRLIAQKAINAIAKGHKNEQRKIPRQETKAAF